LENLIVAEAKRTGFRYTCLERYIYDWYGIAISRNTVRAILKPYEKLKEVHDGLINMNVVNFPVITLEELTAMVHSAFFWLTSFEPLSLLLHGGNYLHGRCHPAMAPPHSHIRRYRPWYWKNY